jgi:hypothetical protein
LISIKRATSGAAALAHAAIAPGLIQVIVDIAWRRFSGADA